MAAFFPVRSRLASIAEKGIQSQVLKVNLRCDIQQYVNIKPCHWHIDRLIIGHL